MPSRKKTPAAIAEPDPMDQVKVEVHAGMGDSAIKAECTLGMAHLVLVRLHQELELAGKIKPSILPHIEIIPGDSTWVPDDDGYGEADRKHKRQTRPKLGF